MTIVTHASGRGSIPLRRAPRPVRAALPRRTRPSQPVVGVELVQRVDGLPLPLVRRICHSRFEHPDERERHCTKECAAERNQAMAGVTVALRESSPQAGPEEEKKERDEGCDQEGDDLVLA